MSNPTSAGTSETGPVAPSGLVRALAFAVLGLSLVVFLLGFTDGASALVTSLPGVLLVAGGVFAGIGTLPRARGALTPAVGISVVGALHVLLLISVSSAPLGVTGIIVVLLAVLQLLAAVSVLLVEHGVVNVGSDRSGGQRAAGQYPGAPGYPQGYGGAPGYPGHQPGAPAGGPPPGYAQSPGGYGSYPQGYGQSYPQQPGYPQSGYPQGGYAQSGYPAGGYHQPAPPSTPPAGQHGPEQSGGYGQQPGYGGYVPQQGGYGSAPTQALGGVGGWSPSGSPSPSGESSSSSGTAPAGGASSAGQPAHSADAPTGEDSGTGVNGGNGGNGTEDRTTYIPPQPRPDEGGRGDGT